MVPPLHEAVFSNNVKLVQELLSQGADINEKEPSFGDSPLNYLLTNKSLSTSELLSMAKILTAAGADVNSVNFCRAESVLHRAAFSHNLPMIEHLVSCGADVNLCDYANNTSLHMIAGQIDLVTMKTPKNTLVSQLRGAEILLKNKVDVNVKNRHGNNALMLAVRHGYPDLARILIDWGSDVSPVSIDGLVTALHYACFRYDHKLVKLLLRKGTPVDVEDLERHTALMWTLLSKQPQNRLETLKALLKGEPDVNTVDLRGCNILTLNPNLENESVKIVLEYLAKMEALNLSLHPSLLFTIKNKSSFNNYFGKCKKELSEAKNDKIHDSSVTYFDLLSSDEKKLMNYARNESLVQNFENSDYMKKYRIFGPYMQKNMSKAIKRSNLYENATKSLRQCLPKDSTDLIVERIINFFDKLDLKKLSQDA